MDLSAKAEALRAVHHEGPPLLLPNVWDAASARLVAARGLPAVATSSHAVAGMLGHDDADTMPPDDAFGAVARVVRAVDVPVTADLEAGYRLEPDAFVARLLEAGAVGCNLEDTDHHGPEVLVDADAHAGRLSAIKAAARAAGVDIVLNARVDVWLRADRLEGDLFGEGLRRARLYVDAGADCIYPIFLTDDATIGSFVEAVGAPVNVTLRPGAPPLSRLRDLGVRRVSLAGGIHRAAMAAVAAELDRLRSELGA